MSRLRALGLYHDLDFKDGQQELGTPFKPMLPVEQITHTPIEVHELFVKPDIANLQYTKNLTSYTDMGIQAIPR